MTDADKKLVAFQQGFQGYTESLQLEDCPYIPSKTFVLDDGREVVSCGIWRDWWRKGWVAKYNNNLEARRLLEGYG